MWNIQNLIILIVLPATTLVNSMHQPGTSSGSSREITEEDIQAFANHVEHYRRITDCTGDTVDGLVNHLKSWSHWNRTSVGFRKNCVMVFRQRHYLHTNDIFVEQIRHIPLVEKCLTNRWIIANLSAFIQEYFLINSANRDQVSTEGGFGRMAYHALNAGILAAAATDTNLLTRTNHPELGEEMHSIAGKGEYLKFAAYFHSADLNTIQRLVGGLGANEPHLKDHQAKLIAFLQEYLTEFH